jgi:hypothetical protein
MYTVVIHFTRYVSVGKEMLSYYVFVCCDWKWEMRWLVKKRAILNVIYKKEMMCSFVFQWNFEILMTLMSVNVYPLLPNKNLKKLL